MRWLIVLALLLATANLAWWRLHDGGGPRWRSGPAPGATAGGALPARDGPGAASAAGEPREAAGAVPAGDAATMATPPPPASPAGLVVPVQGVHPDALRDTFGDARGGERRHEALDIMAPAGTPVLAVADGHIEKLFTSDRGGLTIYQFEPGGTWCYYYAHLEAYAPGLSEGQAVRRGEVIGRVGSTGNADPQAPHLHFAVFALTPERRWWEGTAVDPLPLLRAGPASTSPGGRP